MYCQSVLVTCNHLVPTSIQSMTSTKKADPSSLFSESISTFTKSATKAFDVFQNQAHGDIARAETDAQQARNQRDEALKALQESTNESQRLKDHVLELKAQISHHIENYALLQRETNQWKDQAKNWQEHFLRVEQERCSLVSQMDELGTERLIVPLINSKSTTLLTTHSDASQPPTYHSTVPGSSTQDSNLARSPTPSQNSRSTGKPVKRKVPIQSELPSYSEVAQKTTKASTSATNPTNRSPVRVTAKSTATSRKKKIVSPPDMSAASPNTNTSKEPRQIFIRRVRAVVKVKQEEESNEDCSEPLPSELPEEPVLTSQRPRKTRRARQIIDDDNYVPDNSDKDDEDDELMIGAGDDLSFDIDSPSSTRPADKKRKLDTSTNSKPGVKRKR
ncbi:hypothetical protein Ac2012v2_005541 [Leucoagaricus gongylophorus]